jgi:hypothetical protein
MGPVTYAFSHLRKRTPETAAATIAVARDITQTVRTHFVEPAA